MKLLWSSFYLDNICDECEKCCDIDECNAYLDEDRSELNYDFLDELMKEDFEMKFGENNFEYFVIGINYKNYYGLHQNFNGGYTDLFSSVDEIINYLSHGDDGFRIYKDKYNSIVIERSHHDGKEYYKLCRLNDVGQRYYDNGYNFNYKKYAIKGTFNDFEFYRQ